MLESYYKFFQPDANSRYNYDTLWDRNSSMSYEKWIMTGRIGMNSKWRKLCPEQISTKDLSPLSLECMYHDRQGKTHLDYLFRLEKPDQLKQWLSERLENPNLELKITNGSENTMALHYTADMERKIKMMFPEECRIYGI